MKHFIKKIWNWVKSHKWWAMLIAVALLVGFCAFVPSSDTPKSQFATIEITRGRLRQVVTATGEIMPINTIMIGSQVSGNIDKILVDFNSKVKKGDVLLRIEPSVLQASVDEAQAALTSAQSQRNYAKNEYNRNKMLYNDGFIARAEMEQSQTTYEQAEQAVKRSQSQYDRAVTNLGYATIISPVDGTVISRKVDHGQTVAASFSAPELFEIAEDLSKMQIETAVSEADIGMIKEGQSVTFTVDAYPTKTFQGNVKQIRLSPTTTSNVVVYTVVIYLDNSDLTLMPGMTAFVTILIAEKDDVFKAQNAAFLTRNFRDIMDPVPDGVNPRNNLALERDGSVVLVPYEKGLITATETEIISNDVNVGDKIITGKLGQQSSTSVRMGGPMGGRR